MSVIYRVYLFLRVCSFANILQSYLTFDLCMLIQVASLHQSINSIWIFRFRFSVTTWWGPRPVVVVSSNRSVLVSTLKTSSFCYYVTTFNNTLFQSITRCFNDILSQSLALSLIHRDQFIDPRLKWVQWWRLSHFHRQEIPLLYYAVREEPLTLLPSVRRKGLDEAGSIARLSDFPKLCWIDLCEAL